MPSDFDCMESLISISLSNNWVGALDADLFTSLSQITSIQLSDINLKVIPDGLFRTNHLLSSLDLSNNRLIKIPTNLFAYNPKLAFLALGSANQKLLKNLESARLISISVSRSNLRLIIKCDKDFDTGSIPSMSQADPNDFARQRTVPSRVVKRETFYWMQSAQFCNPNLKRIRVGFVHFIINPAIGQALNRNIFLDIFFVPFRAFQQALH